MENNLTTDTLFKCKALGIYQIAGGAIGLALTVWIITNLTTVTVLLAILLLVAAALYGYSIYCGILLLKKNVAGLDHSLANQFLQLLNFSIAGYTFKYISGIFVSTGLDLTDSFGLTFNLGISSWNITINGDTAPLIFNFNFVALFLIIFIDRLKKKIQQDKTDKQIASIGESLV